MLSTLKLCLKRCKSYWQRVALIDLLDKADLTETQYIEALALANMLMCIASPRPVFATFHTVEVSQKSSRESLNATYEYSYPVGARKNRL